MLGHLCTFCSKMLEFQAGGAENVKDEVSAFCPRIAAALSYLAATLQRGVGAALNESMTCFENYSQPSRLCWLVLWRP